MTENDHAIIFVFPRLVSGGAEGVLNLLATKLAKENNVILLTTQRVQDIPLDFSASYSIFQCSNLIQFFMQLKSLYKSYKKLTVISSFTDINILLCLFKKIRFKNIRLILREAIHPFWHLNETKLGLLYKLGYRLYSEADEVICLTDEMKEDLKKLIPPTVNSVHVIPNFFDTDLDLSWSPPKDEIIITTVGRLCYQKGYDQLIKAFYRLTHQYEDVKLRMIGDGPEKRNLKNLTRGLGIEKSIIFEGWVENPFEYVSKSSFYVMSSRYEGFSNAMFETLYCGVPVLATAQYTGATQINHFEEVGHLVSSCSEADLSKGLAYMYENINEFKAEKIQNLAHELINLTRTIDQYMNLILNLSNHSNDFKKDAKR